MDFQAMVKSENTDECFDGWKPYRDELTDTIVNGIEDYYRRKKLIDSGKKQFFNAYDMEQIIRELGKKPTLAIWGAGGCNDIDISKLAKYFKLVLIDHNTRWIEATRKKYNLRKMDCVTIDLKFWDISQDDYLMFEALVKDKAPIDEIEGFFYDLIAKMSKIDYQSMPSFDFSVGVGLFSQLNSRFAAMAHINEYPYDITGILFKINQLAVECTMDAISKMTNNAIVLGYEERVLYDASSDEAELIVDALNEARREGFYNSGTYGKNLNSEVWGNQELCEYIKEGLEKNSLEYITEKNILWCFTSDKFYIMNVPIFRIQ